MPEQALLSLRSRSNADEWNKNVFGPAGFRRLEEARALAHLAELPLHRFGVLRRLAVIHDLVTGDLNQVPTEQALQLVGSVVGPERSEEAWNLAIGLESRPGLDEFIRLLQDRGLVSPLLKPIASPVCETRKRADGAIEISASYETPGEVKEFYFGADPMNWPVCNPFFLKMTRKGGWFRAPDADNFNGRGYGSRIEEVVGVPFTDFQFRTVLSVRYFVAETAVGMEFDIADGGDGAIDVDHGFVVVEARPGKKVRIRSEKTVRFTRLSEAPAAAACALGWIDMMHGMAICDGDCATDLTDLAEVSIRRNVDRVAKAYAQTAAGNYGPKQIVRDTARFWGQVISDGASAGILVGKYLRRYSEDAEPSQGANGDQARPE